MEIIEKPTLDLLADTSPALSTTNDIPVVETKPDSQPDQKPAPEAKAEEKKEAAPPKEGEKPAESATAEQPEEDPAANTEVEGKPKAKGVQKRIDELVRQREEEKAEKLRLLAMLEQREKPKQEPKEQSEDEPQRPSREAFADSTAFENALADYADKKADWSARRAVQSALAEEAQKVEQRQFEEARKASQEAYQARVTKATEKYADYNEVALSPNVTVTQAMAQAILHTEHGPDIQYFLGKNPEEAKRISSLNPAAQLVEMGLIAARLSAPAEKPQPKPPVSSAPKPPKPLEAKSEQAAKTPDEESMDEYAARRQREMAAERRPGARR
jgi:hypothetical protein